MRNNEDAFSTLHPTVVFGHFVTVVGVSVVFLHPLILAVSFVGALAYVCYLKGWSGIRKMFPGVLAMMVFAALFNPIFNHRGMTILCYWYDNPITLESILYGLAASLMIGAVLLWFVSYNQVMTSDKFLCVFGRMIPALSLTFSMVLRFLPRYFVQAKHIAAAQRGIGRDVFSGSWYARARHGSAVFSIMLTWALENAVDTSDSMLARGYGLPGRTAYTDFRFRQRDLAAGVTLGGGLLVVIVAIVAGVLRANYFPIFDLNAASYLSWLVIAVWGLICATPLIMGLREEAVWRSLRLNL
ncbi:MAG: energy-coupling factor transporter transmembrane protein EcfT [Propionibacteriaceae bacterium]|jgi:energy-coupling factor transport system permease protein|nr:energy-coupling factor transporter transmembrane protein EcfT [Propionibacteriaceae bacterium]